MVRDSLKTISPPNAPLTVNLMVEIANLDVVTRDLVISNLATGYTLWLYNYLISEAQNIYTKCLVAMKTEEGNAPAQTPGNPDRRNFINRDDLEHLKNRIEELRKGREDLLAMLKIQKETFQPVFQFVSSDLEVLQGIGSAEYEEWLKTQQRVIEMPTKVTQ